MAVLNSIARASFRFTHRRCHALVVAAAGGLAGGRPAEAYLSSRLHARFSGVALAWDPAEGPGSGLGLRELRLLGRRFLQSGCALDLLGESR